LPSALTGEDESLRRNKRGGSTKSPGAILNAHGAAEWSEAEDRMSGVILPPPPDFNELPSALMGEDENLRRNIQGGGSTIVIESRAGSDFERAWRGRVERGGGQEVWSNPPPPPKKLNEDYSCT